MSAIETAACPARGDLDAIGRAYGQAAERIQRRVIVCAGTGCVASGALPVTRAFVNAIEAAGLPVTTELRAEGVGSVHLSQSGCQGFCQMGTLVTIHPERILYTCVRPEDVPEIVDATLIAGEVVERLLYAEPLSGRQCRGTEEIPFYVRQARTVLKQCGEIDPEDIHEFIYHGGYRAARAAFTRMAPEAICEEITYSGLRGRGGGGFPTGRKWDLARQQPGAKKYVICNGDEGDPGAFMDRSLMEGNPHGVIEGVMIAARAIGADEAVIYIRTEYPLAVNRMRKAVADAEAMGIVGERIWGTDLSLHVSVFEGAGAFVCGEETALIASIEGRRGMPMPKPPFPAQEGLYGKPTVINNVETLATVPLIMEQGAASYRALGTESSPGTKTFALTGHVANTGLIEVPFGATLREIVHQIGGGVTDVAGALTGEEMKAVQIGGPSGGCLTEEHLDLPLDFDSLRGVGAMVGSGGLVVMNRQTCMVAVARFFMQFTQNESCGKCVLCREGTKQMLALLEDVTEGRGTVQTLELLEKVARAVQIGSLCGLGKTAPNPVLSTLRYFRAEYEAHVVQRRCPAGQCKALQIPAIDPLLCKGCTLCLRKCPVEAITGERRQPHLIDPERCTRCGICAQICKFNAVTGV